MRIHLFSSHVNLQFINAEKIANLLKKAKINFSLITLGLSEAFNIFVYLAIFINLLRLPVAPFNVQTS